MVFYGRARMLKKRLFATKSIEMLHAEMAEDEGRLRRALGPIGLTALGVGAIIGAGIFVMAGRVAAESAGPAIVVSFAFAAFGCALAALCYAEFAAMAPVAGSAYTYAYATLGELFAWIIGWDLILEYAASCSVVGSVWTNYLNEFTRYVFDWQFPWQWSSDPFSTPGAYFNLPSVLILIVATAILVKGIRESSFSNSLLVMVKLGVVLFVIALGIGYVNFSNFTDISPEERNLPAAKEILPATKAYVAQVEKGGDARINELAAKAQATYKVRRAKEIQESLVARHEMTDAIETRLNATLHTYSPVVPTDPKEMAAIDAILKDADARGEKAAADSWGVLGIIGLRSVLLGVDDSTRSPFMPYGISGLMLGASLVFFAFIGFDSISTHSEEAKKPQRDVPLAIIASLVLCTFLYVSMAVVIVGMEPYPTIDTKAAVASAFREYGEATGSHALRASGGLIAAGALAGMTSVILITFLSQARVFLAMARDGLLPRRIFASVHPRFKTPHISTMLVGFVTACLAAFTPAYELENMVNIGTLFAFVVVCAAVLILRIRRPDAERPFKCPVVFIVAPLGILVNVTMMLFLPLHAWLRLLIWLGIGMVIYVTYGYWNSRLGKRLGIG
jgi:APA family basic amino acid/polyamine antiporter